MSEQEKRKIYIKRGGNWFWRTYRFINVLWWTYPGWIKAEVRFTFLYGWSYLRQPIEKRRKFRSRIKERRKYPNSFKNKKGRLKNSLAKRDGPYCRTCLRYNMQPMPPLSELTIDHIVPIALGGTHDLDNLQLLCKEHHKIKDNQKKGGYTKKDEKVWFPKKKIYTYEILTFAKGVLEKEAEEDY